METNLALQLTDLDQSNSATNSVPVAAAERPHLMLVANPAPRTRLRTAARLRLRRLATSNATDYKAFRVY
ncbi:MAG: hypothetical protein IPG25_00750 [Proteobacteria bacterium]|nr:hypothetical protein [Pseudomonadota bacterium]